MGVFEHFPYTNFHNLNLDWILNLINVLNNDVESLNNWRDTHNAEYDQLADKVEGLINSLVDVITPWDSSIAYKIYSIVSYQGVNYIAVQDVPVGTMITNTDYWVPANTVIEQINAIGATVNELTVAKDNYIDVVMYGVPNDGSDITASLQSLIDENPQRTLYFPDGVYTLSSPIYTNKEEGKETSLVFSRHAEVVAANDFTGEFMFELNSTGSSPRNNNRKVFFENGILKCNHICSGIIVRGCRNAVIKGTFIYDVKRVGIQIFDSTYRMPADSLIDDVYVSALIGSTDTYGFITHGSEVNINNSRTARCAIGIKSYRGGIMMNTCHFTQREPENFSSIDDYNNTIGFDFSEGGSSNMESCFADNYAVGFKLPEDSCNLIGCAAYWYTHPGHHYCIEQLTGGNFLHNVSNLQASFYGKETGQVNILLHGPQISQYNATGTSAKFTFSGDQSLLEYPFSDKALMSSLTKIYDTNVGDYATVTQNNWTPIACIKNTGSGSYNLHIQDTRGLNAWVGITFDGTSLTKQYVQDLTGNAASYQLALSQVPYDHTTSKTALIYIRRTTGNATDDYKVFHMPMGEEVTYFLPRNIFTSHFSSLINVSTVPNQIGSAITLDS